MKKMTFFLSLLSCVSFIVGNDAIYLTLDEYLLSRGFKLSPGSHGTHNEGYMTDSQKRQFIEKLKSYSKIETVAEIGLNGGHSAECFFQNCPELKKFTSFDIHHHPYSAAAVDYFYQKYQDRFEFIKGNSLSTVPHYAANNREEFDLLYVDGSHTYEDCLQDIIHFKSLARRGSILWVDDYNTTQKKAVDEAVKSEIIEILGIYHSYDPQGERTWAECRYK